MSVADDIRDAAMSHDIGLRRLSNATVRKVVALLNRLDARVAERLLKAGTTELSKARQKALLADIRAMIDSVYEDATGALNIDLEQIGKYEASYQADKLGRVVPVNVEWVTPSETQIVAAVNSRPFQGRFLKEWYSKLPIDAKERMRNTIRMGIVEGQSIESLVRQVRGTRAQGYKDGILEIDRRNAEAVVRTAVNHTVTRAREATFEANARYIKGQQVLATLDGRTSAQCRAADGAVVWGEGYTKADFPSGTRFLSSIGGYTNDSRPPFHINCRSTMIPVVRSLEDFGVDAGDYPPSTRSSMDGQVASDQSYSDWLRKKPKAYQEEILGRDKAKLFRDGGLDLDKFLRSDRTEMSLDELRKKEAGAWEAAFGD